MSQQTRTVLKTYFQTGDKPTQAQFGDLIDSMFNLSEDSGSVLTTGSLQEVLSVGNHAGPYDIRISPSASRKISQDDGSTILNEIYFNGLSGFSLHSSDYSGLIGQGYTTITQTPTTITINGGSPGNGFQGIKYSQNYGNYFSSRSLVDKAYIDLNLSCSISTPEFAGSSNINTSQSYTQYTQRIGNRIHVDGVVRVAATAKGVAFFLLNNPTGATITGGLYGIVGTATAPDASGSVATISNASNTARFDFNAKHTSNIDFTYHYSYFG